MFRSKEIQFLKDQLARERAERLDLVDQLTQLQIRHSEEIKFLQAKLIEVVELVMRPRLPNAVPASQASAYPGPLYPGYRPSTEPPRTGDKLHIPEVKSNG